MRGVYTPAPRGHSVVAGRRWRVMRVMQNKDVPPCREECQSGMRWRRQRSHSGNRQAVVCAVPSCSNVREGASGVVVPQGTDDREDGGRLGEWSGMGPCAKKVKVGGASVPNIRPKAKTEGTWVAPAGGVGGNAAGGSAACLQAVGSRGAAA